MKRCIVVAVALLSAGVARAAVPSEWKPCEKEIKKYCKGASESSAIMECIEKREKMGKKSGLSKSCYQAHEKMESPEHEAREKESGEQHEKMMEKHQGSETK